MTNATHQDDSLFRSRLAAIESLHQSFATKFAHFLSHDLNARIDARALPAFQLPYHEFRLTLSTPTVLSVFTSPQFQGQLCLELTPRLAYLLIERMLGGPDAEPLIPKRPFTPLESRLLSRILDRALEQLSSAFTQHIATDFTALSTASDAGAIHIVPPDEWVTVLSTEIYLNRHGGRLTFCLPHCALDRLPLSPQSSVLSPGPTELIALLPDTTMKLRDLLTLQVGDIITTDAPAGSDVALIAGGQPRFQGQLVQFRHHRAVQITRRL